MTLTGALPPLLICDLIIYLLIWPSVRIINVEELNVAKQNGQWIKSSFILPFQKLYDYICVVYQNRFLVIGGRFHLIINDTIHEIHLTHLHTPSCLSRCHNQYPVMAP